MAPLSAQYISQSKGQHILGAFWAVYALSAILVAARLYIRGKMLRNTGPEDYIIVVSMVMLSAYTILTTVNVYLGFGSHAAVIQQNGGQALLEKVILVNFVDFVLGIMSFTTPKLAVASLLIRILNPGRFHRIWLWFLTGLVFVASSICIIVLFTMCDPSKALWQVHLVAEGATCRPIRILIDYAIFTGAISAFVDLYLAVYPTVILMRLQMTLKKKLALSAVLGLGAIACAMAIVKCFQLPGLANKEDSTFATAEFVIWTSIESSVIIIASCTPTLGPLYEIGRGKRSWHSFTRYYKSSKEPRSVSFEQRNQQQKPKPGKGKTKPKGAYDDDLLLTTNLGATNLGTTKNDSEESILRSTGEIPIRRSDNSSNTPREYERAEGECS